VIGVTNMKIPLGEGLGFAIPARYVRDFLRNRDAFAYDKSNPNSGYDYKPPPARLKFGAPPGLNDATGK
jgi:serine protease Do